jgi:hypothetical protein
MEPVRAQLGSGRVTAWHHGQNSVICGIVGLESLNCSGASDNDLPPRHDVWSVFASVYDLVVAVFRD